MPERLRATLAKARAASEAGDHESAAQSYFRAAETARSADLPGELAFCLRHGAQARLEVGCARTALDAGREAAEIYRRTEGTKGLNYANSARLVALANEALGASEEARPLWAEARRIYEVNGVREGVSECDAHLAASGQGQGG